MQENHKFTLKFLDKSLANISRSAFEIDNESKAILGIIASHGPVSETKIANLGKRRIILSRDIIRRRLLVTDLSSDFLSVKKGKKIGNLKGKREKFYSLTFKGVLASIVETPIQENFWIKHYLEMVKKITGELTANEFLNHIYYSIGAFLILHSIKRGMLTTFKDPEEEFYENYSIEGELPKLIHKPQVKGIPDEHKELFIHCVVQFFVSCEVIGNLLKTTLQKNLFPKYLVKDWDKPSYMIEDEITDDLFRRWMWTMFMTHDKTLSQILKEYENDDDYEDDELFSFENILGDEKWDNVSFMAADELKKIIPKLKIKPHEFVNKSRTGQGHSLFTI